LHGPGGRGWDRHWRKAAAYQIAPKTLTTPTKDALLEWKIEKAEAP
jgi:hypothetical protein